ncbi:stage III sporulation protein AG [Pullulanibacillus sp. KACC 23026]|uniref:stage III sporulation protein AG n=1 Tax=Pullulanibacillus sp. KACC 23026 TaxID=3028315 RepID=UPI0023B0366A|nr:stage III sporulation protein AG [Pullulanibacillus sp. KACC 23026]WEG14312.1 stage III sporulation protein AG [Pullulanibacillus sp. KACC 23026]
MSPQEMWKKILAAVSTKTGKSPKKPLKNLLILLGIGIALMLLSHFYSGGVKPKTQATAETAGTQTSSDKGASQPASLLKKTSDHPQTMDEYASYYEDRLKSMLDSMAGISNAKVLVTLSSGPEQVYQQDVKTSDQKTTEHDSNGGTRSTVNKSDDSSLVTIDQGNGQKSPILVTEKGPTVKAILVVANGVTRPSAQERVINAVSTVLDVPSYKVSVQERK